MAVWILAGLCVAIVAAIVVALTHRPDAKAAAERRKRFVLEETGEQIPFAEERPAEPATGAFEGGPGYAAAGVETLQAGSSGGPTGTDHGLLFRPPDQGVTGRMVQTPDGEMILTTPPFRAREALVSTRARRYINALYRKLPPWVIVCPRVRLEALVTPTSPDGRDPEDWRNWRRRVRVRAVDIVLCDRRDFRPVLAIMIDGHAHPKGHQAMTLGGGKDRLIDEVLLACGIPLVRGSGVFPMDWPMIRPYVDQAIMRSPTDDEIHAAEEARRPSLDGTVALLKMDDEKGWLLE